MIVAILCRASECQRDQGGTDAIPGLAGDRPAHAVAHPEDVKTSHPRASILKAGRVVFNIKGNDYRLIAAL